MYFSQASPGHSLRDLRCSGPCPQHCQMMRVPATGPRRGRPRRGRPRRGRRPGVVAQHGELTMLLTAGRMGQVNRPAIRHPVAHLGKGVGLGVRGRGEGEG